jgi:hypothetical protein
MAEAITLVPYGELHKFIPLFTPILWKSELVSNGRSSVDDIIKFLYTGEMNLWAIFDDETRAIYGYVVTEIKQYPQSKLLVLQYCAGDPGAIEASGDLVFETLENFAKDGGCDGLEFFGRPGWGPFARKFGCTTQTVIYEKFFYRDEA